MALNYLQIDVVFIADKNVGDKYLIQNVYAHIKSVICHLCHTVAFI